MNILPVGFSFFCTENRNKINNKNNFKQNNNFSYPNLKPLVADTVSFRGTEYVDSSFELKEIEENLNHGNLTKKEIDIFNDIIKNDGFQCVKFARNNDISHTTTRRFVQRALFRNRNENNNLHENEQRYIDDFKKAFPFVEDDEIKNVIIKFPDLLYYSPKEILDNKVFPVSEKFKHEGLSVKDYVKCCLKQPALFSQSAASIENNIKLNVEKFKKEGLTVKDFISGCKKQPSLFCYSPDTLEYNIRSFVDMYQKYGLTTEKYLDYCKRQPQQFCYKPETLKKHMDAYIYVEKNKSDFNDKDLMDRILKKCLSYSPSLIYLNGIIRPQIKQQEEELSDLKLSGLKPRLKEYFKEHPDKQFKINIVKDEMAPEFVKTMEDFCLKEYGRKDVFKFNYINKNQD